MNRRLAPAQHPGVKPGPSYLVLIRIATRPSFGAPAIRAHSVRCVLAWRPTSGTPHTPRRAKLRASVRSSSNRWDAIAERQARFSEAPPRRGDAHCPVDEALTGRRTRGPPCRLACSSRLQRAWLLSTANSMVGRTQVSCPATPLRTRSVPGWGSRLTTLCCAHSRNLVNSCCEKFGDAKIAFPANA